MDSYGARCVCGSPVSGLTVRAFLLAIAGVAVIALLLVVYRKGWATVTALAVAILGTVAFGLVGADIFSLQFTIVAMVLMIVVILVVTGVVGEIDKRGFLHRSLVRLLNWERPTQSLATLLGTIIAVSALVGAGAVALDAAKAESVVAFALLLAPAALYVLALRRWSTDDGRTADPSGGGADGTHRVS